MKATETPPTENSSLLPTTTFDDYDYDDDDFDGKDDDGLSNSQLLISPRRSSSSSQLVIPRRSSKSSLMLKRTFSQDFANESGMRKTTHNDPSLKGVAEDMSTLYGSTRLLYNQMMARQEGKEKESSIRSEPSKPQYPSSPIMRMRQSIVSTVYESQPGNFLDKIKTNFFEDAKSLSAGTIPQSVVVAMVIGTVCGIACWLYYSTLYFMLELLWNEIPERIIQNRWKEEYYWCWIPIVSVTMVVLVGLSVIFLGEPGDLPYTVSRVQHFAYIPVDHVLPMVFASLFSILAGGSL